VAEGPVGAAVGDELEPGDGVGDELAEGADRAGDLRHELVGAQGDGLLFQASGAAPGPRGVQLAVPVPVGEGDAVDDHAMANGDALQPPRRHRDVVGAAVVAGAPRPDLHQRRLHTHTHAQDFISFISQELADIARRSSAV